MAQMYPDPLPTYIEEDPLRKAESRVYYALKTQLPEDFLVFYSRPWLGLEPDGREIDGETDFTVAHEELGILTIEVKGGVVSRNGQTDQWTSKDGFGIVHKIKNPVIQASKGKYHLLKKLNNSPLWESRFINARHGIILPGSSRPANDMDLGADMPLNIFAFGEDMRWLGDWVKKRMQLPESTYDVRKVPPLGRDGLNALKKLLASSFQLRTNLGAVFSAEEQRIIQLTEEQYHVLDDLELHKKLAIAGAAGTGKTMLALEKAKRLANQGHQTLFVCFNRSLSAYLSGLVENIPGLSVMTFHQLCGKMAYAAGITVPDKHDSDRQGFYTNTLPEILIDALAINPGLRFDAIIVDEGQDFLPEWWDALQLTLKDEEEGILYVFYDDNQRVYGHESKVAPAIPHLPYRLTRNLRNTQEIFKAAIPWYQGGITRAAGPTGEQVEWIASDSITDHQNQIKGILGQMINNDKVPIEDIGVICASTEAVNMLCKNNMLGRYSICSIEKPQQNHITVDTVRKFKGLERSVVILSLLQSITDPELIYVAMTRAKHYLAVIGDIGSLEFVKRQPQNSQTTNVN